MRIWGRTSSFNVQKVLWLVGELGLSYEHIPAGGDWGGLNTPEFLQMNPHGRIPVIEDDGIIVWESHAILRYVAAKYGRDRFWSLDPAVRARAEQWMDWSQTSLQPDFLMGVFWGYYRTPRQDRDWPTIHKMIGRCASHFMLLDKVLAEQDYLAGSVISLADIPVGTSLYRYFELDIARPSLPNVTRWYRQLQERAPYQRHVMVPFDELRGRLRH